MDIDDLLKKSFEQPSIVYKEDYWQAASAKLDQHFRRKFYFQFSVIALILILFTSLGYFFYSESIQKLDWFKNKNTTEEIESGIVTSKENDQNNVSINSNKEEEIVDPVIPNSPHLDSKYSTAPINADVSTSNEIKNQNSPEPSHKFKEKIHQRNNFTASKSSHQSLKNKESEAIIENNIKYNNAVTIELDAPKIPIENILVDYENKELLIEESKPLEDDFMPFTNLACLALPFNALMEQEAIQLDRVNLDIEQINPVKDKSYLEYGIMAEISTFPKFTGDNKNILGGNAGLELRYHFNNKFLLRSGINFGYRSGSFSPSIYSTQKTFFLGPQEDAFVFRPTGLVSITLPLQFGYSFDKYMIGFGINNHFLAATYGNLEYAESDFRNNSNNKPFEEFTLIEKGWLNNAGLRKFVNSYQVSINRTIYNRLSAGINVQYFPKDWTTESYGQVYSFEAGQYINPAFDSKGLIEKNWIVNFNIYYRL